MWIAVRRCVCPPARRWHTRLLEYIAARSTIKSWATCSHPSASTPTVFGIPDGVVRSGSVTIKSCLGQGINCVRPMSGPRVNCCWRHLPHTPPPRGRGHVGGWPRICLCTALARGPQSHTRFMATLTRAVGDIYTVQFWARNTDRHVYVQYHRPIFVVCSARVAIHRVKWRHRVYGHDAIAILWV